MHVSRINLDVASEVVLERQVTRIVDIFDVFHWRITRHRLLSTRTSVSRMYGRIDVVRESLKRNNRVIADLARQENAPSILARVLGERERERQGKGPAEKREINSRHRVVT